MIYCNKRKQLNNRFGTRDRTVHNVAREDIVWSHKTTNQNYVSETKVSISTHATSNGFSVKDIIKSPIKTWPCEMPKLLVSSNWLTDNKINIVTIKQYSKI